MIDYLQKKIKRLFQMRFIKDLMVMQVGNFISTGLSLVASIVYARILGVESYAAYALIFSFVALVNIFINIGASQTALTLMAESWAKRDKEEIKFLGAFFIKSGLLVLIIGAAIAIMMPTLTAKLYQHPEIGRLARFIIFGNLIQISWNFYCIAMQVVRRIKRLTLMENYYNLLNILLPVALVLMGFGLSGLVWGYFIGSAVFAVYAVFAYRRLRLAEPLLPGWREMLLAWDKKRFVYYFRFGFLIAVDKNISGFYSTLPYTILGIFNLRYVAYLKVALACAQIPLLAIGPVSRLLMVQLPQSKAYSFKILRRDYLRSIIGSMLICAAISLPLMFVAKYLIFLVYGSSFMAAVALTYPFLIANIINGAGVADAPIFRTLHLLKPVIVINATIIAVGGLAIFCSLKYLPINMAVYPIAFWLPTATVIAITYCLMKLDKKIKNNQSITI
jgi:O-antigen/teichoic acid export membrane protein